MPMHRVIYVEDNPVNVLIVEELLAAWPAVQLEVAPTGALGVAAVRAARCHLLLVDLDLPDMNGWQVLNAVRALPGGDQLPCIALSAHSALEMEARALRAGFHAYWPKPIDFAQFRQGVSELLRLESTRAP